MASFFFTFLPLLFIGVVRKGQEMIGGKRGNGVSKYHQLDSNSLSYALTTRPQAWQWDVLDITLFVYDSKYSHVRKIYFNNISIFSDIFTLQTFCLVSFSNNVFAGMLFTFFKYIFYIKKTYLLIEIIVFLCIYFLILFIKCISNFIFKLTF